ncbi:hypothetical protein AAC387_Pa05g0936 [Persea americana]
MAETMSGSKSYPFRVAKESGKSTYRKRAQETDKYTLSLLKNLNKYKNVEGKIHSQLINLLRQSGANYAVDLYRQNLKKCKKGYRKQEEAEKWQKGSVNSDQKPRAPDMPGPSLHSSIINGLGPRHRIVCQV